MKYEKAPEAGSEDGKPYVEMKQRIVPKRNFLAFISALNHILSRIIPSFQGNLFEGS
jgi:hypothetical protein